MNALDSFRPQALQRVEKCLQLKEHLRRSVVLKPQPAYKFQFGQYVNQRRVEGWVQQLQIVRSNWGISKLSLNDETII